MLERRTYTQRLRWILRKLGDIATAAQITLQPAESAQSLWQNIRIE